jgi:hypothetical protein
MASRTDERPPGRQGCLKSHGRAAFIVTMDRVGRSCLAGQPGVPVCVSKPKDWSQACSAYSATSWEAVPGDRGMWGWLVMLVCLAAHRLLKAGRCATAWGMVG